MSSGNWMQSLQALFGGQGGGSSGQNNATNSPFVNWRGMSTLGPGRDSPFYGTTNADPGDRARLTTFSRGSQPGGGMTYGQAMGGALARDYQNAESARQRELGMYQGLLGNVMGSMQGAGQMVNSAGQMGQQNMATMNQQADRMRAAADQGMGFYDDAVKQMMGGISEARGRFDQSIGTLQTARNNYDATRRDDTASEVFGIQSQYKNQLDAITRRDDLSPEQKEMMTSELKQGMRQQSSSLAAQADSKARDTLLALDQNISQMQASAGAQLGQFGIGVGQTMGQLGLQTAAMRQQAEEQIGGFYNNMLQFNSSMMQSAQANALQHTLNGNQLAASIINQMPMGQMSIFETISRMVTAGGYNRNQQINPQMGNLLGGIA
jgi:hypothetical protein